MNIPDKIKIGGFTIDVINVKDLMSNREELGNYHPKYQQIQLDAEAIHQQKEETLLHETIEAINSIYNIDLEHSKLTLLATVLHQVIKDNPEIFK